MKVCGKIKATVALSVALAAGDAWAASETIGSYRWTYRIKGETAEIYKGAFKGSFKLYTTNAATTSEGRLPKLKKFTVNVVGFVVDGVGRGWAELKKPVAVK